MEKYSTAGEVTDDSMRTSRCAP